MNQKKKKKKDEKHLKLQGINEGIVIDHIRAGSGLKVLEYLKIDVTENMVALIMNATSASLERKDIIKIENVTDVDMAALGLIDHTATVNIIRNGEVCEKQQLKLPETVKDVIKCKNPRCVTSVEPALSHVFHLVDAESKLYRCGFCDHIGDF
jgi:aspartate carbamoyltransferase regulatory subunit